MSMNQKRNEKREVKGPVVSQHAMLRYCQRMMGAELSWIIGRIVGPLPVDGSGKVADGRYPLEEGRVYAVVHDNQVLTILAPEEEYRGVTGANKREKLRRKKRAAKAFHRRCMEAE